MTSAGVSRRLFTVAAPLCALAGLGGLAAPPGRAAESSGVAAPQEGQSSDAVAYLGLLSDADVFIEVPALRQYGGYTCGATCVQMLMNWLYPYEADLNLTRYEELLGTTPEAGTSPDAVTGYFAGQGVAFVAAERLTLADLREKLEAGHPVMMPLQAWSAAPDGGYNVDDPADEGTYLAEGHWVVCVGYCENGGAPYFMFNDPACVGHAAVYADELDERWIDQDGAGVVYDHFGIEVTQGTGYDADGLFHMD